MAAKRGVCVTLACLAHTAMNPGYGKLCLRSQPLLQSLFLCLPGYERSAQVDRGNNMSANTTVSPTQTTDNFTANFTVNSTQSPVGSCFAADPYSVGVQAVLGLITVILILLTVIGNVLVILAVTCHRKLRTVTNFLIVSLACADLSVGITVLPFAATNDILGYWPFGGYCDVWVSFDVLNSTASILNLVVIAFDRFLAITAPFTYHTRMTERTAGILIATVWGISLVMSFLPIQAGWYRDNDSEEALAIYADPCLCIFTASTAYTIVSSLISFYIPLLIMLVFYGNIFKAARDQARKIDALEGRIEQENNRRGKKISLAKEKKAAKTLGIIMGVFILCWLPFFVVNIVNPFCDRCVQPAVFIALTWLGWINSCFNPIIYAFNKEFRKVFVKMICCYTCRGVTVGPNHADLNYDPVAMRLKKKGENPNGNVNGDANGKANGTADIEAGEGTSSS
ncbi:PREDICTED: beta-2 adrenergic receptor-like isoform X1 [Branchiostoma belcheri]|uniref:Beta-2 adrenergic receptor-like isoform X1 n=2 Tax=Branchiostoma belcheri TaxID=7741 RepID=A0A6P5AMZ6_BRABE|nr:PREDICTED: beta-2 adrenergic receptor-like isoform X1 [Branchiostoma belcheri]